MWASRRIHATTTAAAAAAAFLLLLFYSCVAASPLIDDANPNAYEIDKLKLSETDIGRLFLPLGQTYYEEDNGNNDDDDNDEDYAGGENSNGGGVGNDLSSSSSFDAAAANKGYFAESKKSVKLSLNKKLTSNLLMPFESSTIHVGGGEHHSSSSSHSHAHSKCKSDHACAIQLGVESVCINGNCARLCHNHHQHSHHHHQLDWLLSSSASFTTANATTANATISGDYLDSCEYFHCDGKTILLSAAAAATAAADGNDESTRSSLVETNNYPTLDRYLPHKKCSWIVKSKRKRRPEEKAKEDVSASVTLSIERFATRLTIDYLYIFEGDSVFGSLLAAFRYLSLSLTL
jgi:hypothetical protein